MTRQTKQIGAEKLLSRNEYFPALKMLELKAGYIR